MTSLKDKMATLFDKAVQHVKDEQKIVPQFTETYSDLRIRGKYIELNKDAGDDRVYRVGNLDIIQKQQRDTSGKPDKKETLKKLLNHLKPPSMKGKETLPNVISKLKMTLVDETTIQWQPRVTIHFIDVGTSDILDDWKPGGTQRILHDKFDTDHNNKPDLQLKGHWDATTYSTPDKKEKANGTHRLDDSISRIFKFDEKFIELDKCLLHVEKTGGTSVKLDPPDDIAVRGNDYIVFSDKKYEQVIHYPWFHSFYEYVWSRMSDTDFGTITVNLYLMVKSK